MISTSIEAVQILRRNGLEKPFPGHRKWAYNRLSATTGQHICGTQAPRQTLLPQLTHSLDDHHHSERSRRTLDTEVDEYHQLSDSFWLPFGALLVS
jgi:hypothetical protein